MTIGPDKKIKTFRDLEALFDFMRVNRGLHMMVEYGADPTGQIFIIVEY